MTRVFSAAPSLKPSQIHPVESHGGKAEANAMLAMRLPFQELKETMYVPKHPKIGNLVAPEGGERGTRPLYKLASRRMP